MLERSSRRVRRPRCGLSIGGPCAPAIAELVRLIGRIKALRLAISLLEKPGTKHYGSFVKRRRYFPPTPAVRASPLRCPSAPNTGAGRRTRLRMIAGIPAPHNAGCLSWAATTVHAKPIRRAKMALLLSFRTGRFRIRPAHRGRSSCLRGGRCMARKARRSRRASAELPLTWFRSNHWKDEPGWKASVTVCARS